MSIISKSDNASTWSYVSMCVGLLSPSGRDKKYGMSINKKLNALSLIRFRSID